MKTKSVLLYGIYGLLSATKVHAQDHIKPNIVLILVDDLGYGDIHCNSAKGIIPTPNIDKLATQGMRFTDAHASASICSPSRYSILTGRYPWRSRLQGGIVAKWEKPLISPGRKTIANLASDEGYQTVAIGKWHLGWDWPIEPQDKPHFTKFGPFEGKTKDGSLKIATPTDEDRAVWAKTFARPIKGGPLAHGFDTYFGMDLPNWPPFCFIENEHTVGIPSEFLKASQVATNLASYQGPALKDWDLTQILPTIEGHATDFIAKHKADDKPFFMYLSLTAPHTPLAVTELWHKKSGLDNDYADLVMETDAVVGHVLDALKANGLEKNTLVIFTSDNGCAAYIGAKDLEAKGHFVNGGLRGYKNEIYEGGNRMPLIIRYPGVVKVGTVNNKLVLQADFMATFADIFGKKLPDSVGEDSYSLLPLLKGRHVNVRKTAIYSSSDGTKAIRKGPWKLICSPKMELYNLDDDITESKNILDESPKLVKELLAIRKKLISNGRSTPGPVLQNDVAIKK